MLTGTGRVGERNCAAIHHVTHIEGMMDDFFT